MKNEQKIIIEANLNQVTNYFQVQQKKFIKIIFNAQTFYDLTIGKSAIFFNVYV